MAQELTARADEELQSGGNEQIAAEFMWGAFAHCLITTAINRGLPHNSHQQLRQLAEQLASSLNQDSWRSDFGAAEQLHIHFYHGNLTGNELGTHMTGARRGVRELLREFESST
jgi:hypothetical protein